MYPHPPETRKVLALTALMENFGKTMPEALMSLWLELLEPYSAADVCDAVKAVIETYEYKTIPPFAVLKRALDDLAGTSERLLELQAVAEWSVLLDAIDRHGYYGCPVLHPTTACVVRLFGGWESVCVWTEKGMNFKRKEFIDLWRLSDQNRDALPQGADAVRKALSGRVREGAEPVARSLEGVIQALESSVEREAPLRGAIDCP